MPRGDAPDSVIHRPGSSWSQFDLGSDFDVSTLGALAGLDPTGENGVIEEVLLLFQESLEPLLVTLEQLRAADSGSGIRFEAHKLSSAAGQIGAVRLARACTAIAKFFQDRGNGSPDTIDGELDVLYHDLVSETIRVHRKLRRLLAR